MSNNIQVYFQMKKITTLLFILFSTLLSSTYTFAYNLKQVSHTDGLSNSSILNLYQDKNNFLWICTFDGLNMYDGSKIHAYRSLNSKMNFSSMVIRQALETDPGVYWLRTNLGLNKFTIKGKKVEKFFTNTEPQQISKNSKNELFAILKQDYLSYFNPEKNEFEHISLPGVNNFWVRSFDFDFNDNLWIFMSTGKYWKLSIKTENGKKVIRELEGLPTTKFIKYNFFENGLMYLIDYDRNFLIYDLKKNELKLQANLASFIEPNGVLRSIVKFENGFLFGFEYNGLFKVKFPTPNVLAIEKLDISCGVYNIIKDKAQDIYWIATDGQGVYMYWNDDYSVKNYSKETLPIDIQKPIRATYMDKFNNLWIGTKGEGIIRIKNYNFNQSSFGSQSVERFHIQSNFNYKLVFCFEQSRNNILWIGGDWPGLSYYSYSDNKTHQTNTIDEKNPLYINFVHSIIEYNDTTLYIGTYGEGFIKAIFSKKDLKIKSIKKYKFQDNSKQNNNIAFDKYNSIYKENDSIIWLGARMNGVVRFNTLTEKYRVIHFEKEGVEQLNDILSICKDKYGTLWFGTNFGLVKLKGLSNNNVDYEVINESNGLTNNGIVGIIEDNGLLYLSSNKGIDIFNPKTKKIRRLNSHNGLNINEFSLDAYSKPAGSNILFFGGIDGFCAIRPEDTTSIDYNPKIHFMGISIFGNYSDLSDFTKGEAPDEYVKLKYSQNFFSIDFVALDYINGINTEYMYQLENYSKVWIDLGKNNTATFTNIPPGTYKLNIKCKTEAHDFSGNIQSLTIVITPPWYASILAKIIYFLLIIAAIRYAFYKAKKRLETNRLKLVEKMRQEQKQEIYDSKLNFWSKIVQEFSTPLTLITGPCQLLLNYAKDNAYISEYVNLIHSNAEKMNNLIRQLHEFKQVSPENNKCLISNIDISLIAESIFKFNIEDANNRNIDYQFVSDKNLLWNSNEEIFSKIVNTLLSNALFHTENEGQLRLSLEKTTLELKVLVYYTGKGMNKDQSEKIFNKYDIMDNVEESDSLFISSESALGLGICHNLVRTLKGEIKVISEIDKYTQFEVILPYQEINVEFNNRNKTQSEPVHESDTSKELNKPVVLIIDKDKEMLWFLNEIFTTDYVIYTALEGESAKKLFETKRIDIIILNEESTLIGSDLAIDFIKSNPLTKHIPLILLSSETDFSDESGVNDSGADAYIRKPFNVDYLKKRVELMLKNKEYLKEYFSSSISSFELLDGNLVHQEDKQLLNQIIKIIDSNISNQDITSDLIAEKLCMSKRKLYRKMKELTNSTPTDFVKNYKLELSASLLKKSNSTVQEIMYKVGFNNRAYFYKEFSKKYSVSPGKYRDNELSDIQR